MERPTMTTAANDKFAEDIQSGKTTWGNYALEHPEEDRRLSEPPRAAATYKAKTYLPEANTMVTRPIPEDEVDNLNLMRRDDDRADIRKSEREYDDYLRKSGFAPRIRSPSRTYRRRSPSRERSPKRGTYRRRSPSRSPRRGTYRRRSPSWGPRRRSRSPRRRSRSPRRRESPIRYMRAPNGRTVNEFGRNLPERNYR